MEIMGFSRNTAFEVKWANMVSAVNGSFNSKQRFNPNYELITVYEGPVYLQVEEKKMSLTAGDTLLLFPWQQHKGWKPEVLHGGFYWVQFQPSSKMIPVSTDDIDWDFPISNLLQIQDTEKMDLILLPKKIQIKEKFKLLSLYEELIAEIQEPKDNYLFRSSLKLGSILEIVSSALLQSHSQIHTVSRSHTMYFQTVAILNNAFMEMNTKEKLVKILNRSYEHIGQVFKKHAGITIVEYIRLLRMQRAKYLLVNTEKKIKTISEEIGYEDMLYFSRIFKESEGLPPSKYRTQFKVNLH